MKESKFFDCRDFLIEGVPLAAGDLNRMKDGAQALKVCPDLFYLPFSSRISKFPLWFKSVIVLGSILLSLSSLGQLVSIAFRRIIFCFGIASLTIISLSPPVFNKATLCAYIFTIQAICLTLS